MRPNSAFVNIVEVVSDAASRQHLLQVDSNINPGALLPAFNGPLVSWKRVTVSLNYSLGWMANNTDGPFSIPATGDLRDEWDRRRVRFPSAVRSYFGCPSEGRPCSSSTFATG